MTASADAIASDIARRIAQGRGLEPADLVIRGRAPPRPRHRRPGRDRHRGLRRHRGGHLRPLRGAAGPGGARPHRRAGLHRHPPPRGVVAGDAAGVRPLRPAARRHDRDLRPARDGQRARHRGLRLFPRLRRAHRHGPARAALLLRARDPPRDRRRRHPRRRPRPLPRPPQGDRPGRVHELPRRARRRPRLPRQARGLRGAARRRPRAAPRRPRPQRLCRGRHPHRPRGHQRPPRRWRRSARA